ncbi:MAG: hypothetical protein GY711_18490 [bacterium]|nr:hypothetical protein [bacterium]
MQVIEQLKTMSGERFLAIYRSLEQDGFGPLDGEVAKVLKFRPQAIRKLPMDQRARRAKLILERKSQADLAYELFGSYLMRSCKELVTGFLDGTGVEHEDGMIENVDMAKPAKDKIAGTIADLDKQFPPEDVTLYLSLCAEQWPGVPELDTLWKMR